MSSRPLPLTSPCTPPSVPLKPPHSCGFFLPLTSPPAPTHRIFRYLCAHLRAKVLTKFPESKYSAIGGFFFLRFLCPAIVSPENYGLVDSGTGSFLPHDLLSGGFLKLQLTVPPLRFGDAHRREQAPADTRFQGAAIDSQRSAVRQEGYASIDFALGVVFLTHASPCRTPEPYMIPMNELMQVNIAKVHNFFDDLAVTAPGNGSASLLASFLPSFAYMQDIAGLEDQFVMGNLGQRELTFRPDQLAKYTQSMHSVWSPTCKSPTHKQPIVSFFTPGCTPNSIHGLGSSRPTCWKRWSRQQKWCVVAPRSHMRID